MATGQLAGQTLTGLAWGPWLHVPNTCSLGGGVLILAHSISVLAMVAGKASQQESEATGHVLFRPQPGNRERSIGTQRSSSFFILSGTAAQGIALSTFRVGQMYG